MSLQNKSIAVLPFVNRSSNKENDFFSDGITEEIINALTKIDHLKVSSRTSSFFFKNKELSITEIASKLNVSTLLEGSVRLSGNMVRISAQLIQVKDGFHFWSETWDRKLENIFAIQDEISLIIADKLREYFGHLSIQDHLVEKQTESIDAYTSFLKAKFYFRKWNPEDVRTSIHFYEKALELDANHTESLLGLADAYGFMATTGFLPMEETWEKSISCTTKALSINKELAGGYYQLSNFSFFIKGNYLESVQHINTALSIEPNSPEILQFISFLKLVAGKKEEAFEHINKVLSIDPLSPETLFFSAYYLYMIEDYTKALIQLNTCLEFNDKNLPAHTIKSYCLLKLGQYNEVIHYFDHLPDEIVVQADKIGIKALAYALNGNNNDVNICLVELHQLAKDPMAFRANSYLFLLYAATQETEKAFDWIKTTIDTNPFLLLIHFADPLVNLLKTDQRYQDYQSILFPENELIEHIKIKKPLLDEVKTALYSEQLMNFILSHQPFKDPNISLRSLAEKLEIHPNQLSWLLNEKMGKNFREFINFYRIEAFKKMVLTSETPNFTLIGMAYECGFSSKTVFNTYFKKEMGMTPKEYVKSVKVK